MYDLNTVQFYNISMIRGDTESFGLELIGLEQDLDSAYLTCKKSYEDETPLFEKALNDGIYKITQEYYGVRIAPEDTENLEAGKYHYDLEICVNGDVFTIMTGYIELFPDVTHGKDHGDGADFDLSLKLEGVNVSVVGETLVIRTGG